MSQTDQEKNGTEKTKACSVPDDQKHDHLLNETRLHTRMENAIGLRDITSSGFPSIVGESNKMSAFEYYQYLRYGEKKEEKVKSPLDLTIEQRISEFLMDITRDYDFFSIGFTDITPPYYLKDDNYYRLYSRKSSCITDLRMGTKVQYLLYLEKGLVWPYAVMNCKNLNQFYFNENYSHDDNGELVAPMAVELKLQFQMLVMGVETAYMGILVEGKDVHLIKRQRDLEVHQYIMDKCKEFWESVDNEKEPKQVPTDCYSIIKKHKYVDVNSEVKDPSKYKDLAFEYAKLGEEERRIKLRKDMVKADILESMGRHHKVVHPDFFITAGKTKESSYMVHKKEGRSFRVTIKNG